MNWNKLKTFYHVVQTGNFTYASRLLNISQPAISKQIADLEYELKTRLFKRTTQGLDITEQGRVLYKTAEKMFSISSLGIKAIAETNQIPQGPFKIITTYAFASIWLLDYLPIFIKENPKLNISIIATDEKETLELCDADAAILPFFSDRLDVEVHHITETFLQLYASKSYLENFGVPKTTEDLDKHRLINFGEYRKHPYDKFNWFLHIGSNGQIREPYIQINTIQGLKSLAEAGLGIITLGHNSPIIKESNLIRVLPEIKGPIIDTYYIYSKQFRSSPRIKSFNKFLNKYFGKDVIKDDKIE